MHSMIRSASRMRQDEVFLPFHRLCCLHLQPELHTLSALKRSLFF